jgi:signal transduction histidine kinase
MHERALFTPIRWRLVAWTLLIVGLILALLGTSIYLTLASSLTDQVDRSLASQSDPGQVFPFLFGGRGEPRGNREGYRGGTFYLALDSSGRVRANPQQVQVDGVSFPASQGLPDRGIAFATLTINDDRTRVAVRATPDGGTLVVGQSLAPEEAALNSLLIILIGGGGIGLLLTIGGAWFLAGRALLPIQQAFRRQQEFVADASHELRTPLTVLRSATDLMDRHRQQPLAEQAELFDDVQSEIRRMERLVQDLLTVARSDRGELELMTAEVDLSKLAGAVVRRMRPLAESRDLRLSLVESPAMALATGGSTNRSAGVAMVDVDPERIQQVVLILLDNAIKYTPAGGEIEVRVSVDGHSAVLDVADTGPGIAPEHLPRIFDRFYRADKARSRAAGGTGLGLTIGKLLVDAHGGELSLASQPGTGTVARLRLRLETPPLTPRPPGLAAFLRAMTSERSALTAETVNENRPAPLTDGLRKLQGSISRVMSVDPHPSSLSAGEGTSLKENY